MALTRRQHEVLEFVRAFIRRNGYSPSLEEIGSALGLASVATVHKHVSHLVEKGYVRRVSNQNRSIEVVDPDESRSAVAVPLVGVLRGGRTVEVAAEETILVPRDMVNGRNAPFVLRVEGSFMTEEQIRDGDYVIMEERREIKDGETVLAVLDDGTGATLRRFRSGGSMVRLESAGPAAQVVRVPEQRLEIRGIVVGMIRRY